MRKLLVLCFFLAANWVTAQGYDVKHFVELSNKSLGEVETILTSEKWYFFNARDEEENRFGNAKFVYDRPNFEMGKTPANFFLTYHYSNSQSAKAVELMFKSRELYKNFTTEMDSLKFRLVSSETNTDRIIKVFRKGGNMIEVTIPTNFKGMNGYSFLFARKSSYRKIRPY